ncbi:MAG: polysaccharide pyruvyl transferase family protein [Chloroflexi bacterium]|nr:polysaccharide pyruvyl transferase family protein [Chloroflexota bacterium]
MTAERPVLVVGGYGYGNVGDEAILAGLLTRLGTDGVAVVSRDPNQTRRMHRVAAVTARDAVGALRRHRSVLIGGGGLFGPDMGRLGRLLPLFGIGATALGRKVTVEGVDVEAQLGLAARPVVQALIRRASRVTVRDEGSRAVVRAMGASAEVVPDLSSLMAPASAAIGREWLSTSGLTFERPVVGLALTGVRRELVPAVVASCAETMDAFLDVEFCFLPMSRHPTVADHDDLRLGRVLHSLRPRLRIVEERAHPATVLAAFGELSAVVAMRYHAMLFADRAGVPLLPIAYAPKNERWLAEHGRIALPPSAGELTAAMQRALERKRLPRLAAVAS